MRLKGLRRMSVFVLLAGASRSSAAQEPSGDTSAVIAWSQLSERPRLADSIALPRIHYPPILEVANVAGAVHLVLVVAPDGRPISGMTRVEQTSHPLFTNSVREATSGWQFTAPMLDGVAVRGEVPVVVTFQTSSNLDGPVREVSTYTVDSLGLQAVAGWEAQPREVTAPSDTADVKWAKLIVLLRLLAMVENPDTAVTTCLRWSDKPAHPLPPRMMSRVGAQYAGVANADACPRAKAGTRSTWVGVDAVEPWTRDLYVVKGRVESDSADEYYCEARRDERGRWGGACELRSSTTR